MDERIKTVEGDLNARGLRFGIVASRFNDFIVDRLLSGATDTLLKHGADPGEIEIVRVPGAFELRLALTKLAASRRHDALIALGFGVLTVDTIEQAIERAGTKAGNKGADAALSAIEMATLLRQFDH